MSHSRLAKALSRLHEHNTIHRGIEGTLGKLLSDNSWVIDVDTRPGWVYVGYNDGGRNTSVEALDSGVSRVPGMPVRLFAMSDGQFEVKAAGTKTATYNGAAARYTGNVSYHTHEKGGGLDDYVSPNRFRPGLVHATTPPSMSVQIETFWHGGTRIAATSFDLTSAQPASASMWAWIVVAYDPDALGFVGLTGDEYSVLTPLDEALVADIDMTGYVPLGAVRVRADDTSIPEVDGNKVSRFAVEDVRHFLGGTELAGDYVLKSLYDANTILAANTDDTPAAVTVAEQRIVGRKTGSSITALTATEVKAMLAIDHGADLAGLSDDDHTQYIVGAPATSARNVIQPSAAGATALTLKAHASQSADLLLIQDNAGSSTLKWDNLNRIIFNRQAFTATTIPAQRSALTVVNRLDDTINTTTHRAIWAAVQSSNNISTVSRVDALNAFVYPSGSATLSNAFAGVYAVRPTSSGAVTLAEGIDSSIAFQTGATSTIATGDLFVASASTVTGSKITTLHHYYAYSPSGAGVIDNLYGIYLEAMSAGGVLNYAIYANAGLVRFGDSVQIAADNKHIIFGTGLDASILYDGTDMIVNPKVVGTGVLQVLGDLKLSAQNIISVRPRA